MARNLVVVFELLTGRITHNFCGAFKELHGKKWAITTTSPLLNMHYLVCQHACMNDIKEIPDQIPNSFITIIDVFKFCQKLHKTSQNCSQKIATSCDICFECCFHHGFLSGSCYEFPLDQIGFVFV